MTDIVELVQRRHEIIGALESGPLGKPGLTDSTTRARSTIDRGLEELEAADLVLAEGSEYRLSAAGRRVLEAYQTFADTATIYSEYATAIEGVDPEDDLPPVLLDGATVESATPAMPTRPVKRGHEGLASADQIYATVPVLLAYHAEFWTAAQPETDASLEVIFDQSILETMHSEYPNWRETLVESGLLTPYVGDEIPSYSLALIDGFAGDPSTSVVNVLVHNDEGGEALLHNRSDAAVAWARDRFRTLRANARDLRE